MNPPDDSVDLEQHLCFSVYSAVHAFNAAYKPLLEPFGLTYPQYLVLLALWQKDGVSVKEIGTRLHLDSGTLSPLLKRLQAAGYVRRNRNPANERQLLVELTKAGHSLRAQTMGLRQALAQALGGAEASIQATQERISLMTSLLRSMSEKPRAY